MPTFVIAHIENIFERMPLSLSLSTFFFKLSWNGATVEATTTKAFYFFYFYSQHPKKTLKEDPF